MKTDLNALARAIVEQSAKLPADQLPALADAALQVLAKNGETRRSRRLPRIVKRLLKRHGPPEVTVETPEPLSKEDVDSLARSIGTALGRDVSVTVLVDPALIGGARVQIGDERFDFSLRGQLQRLPAAFSSLHS